jgi:hypothetical protein
VANDVADELPQAIARDGTKLAIEMGQEERMLFTIAVILFIAWLLGIVGVYTVGTFIHALLVIALVLFVLGLFSGRRAAI